MPSRVSQGTCLPLCPASRRDPLSWLNAPHHAHLCFLRYIVSDSPASLSCRREPVIIGPTQILQSNLPISRSFTLSHLSNSFCQVRSHIHRLQKFGRGYLQGAWFHSLQSLRPWQGTEITLRTLRHFYSTPAQIPEWRGTREPTLRGSLQNTWARGYKTVNILIQRKAEDAWDQRRVKLCGAVQDTTGEIWIGPTGWKIVLHQFADFECCATLQHFYKCEIMSK